MTSCLYLRWCSSSSLQQTCIWLLKQSKKKKLFLQSQNIDIEPMRKAVPRLLFCICLINLEGVYWSIIFPLSFLHECAFISSFGSHVEEKQFIFIPWKLTGGGGRWNHWVMCKLNVLKWVRTQIYIWYEKGKVWPFWDRIFCTWVMKAIYFGDQCFISIYWTTYW